MNVQNRVGLLLLNLLIITGAVGCRTCNSGSRNDRYDRDDDRRSRYDRTNTYDRDNQDRASRGPSQPMPIVMQPNCDPSLASGYPSVQGYPAMQGDIVGMGLPTGQGPLMNGNGGQAGDELHFPNKNIQNPGVPGQPLSGSATTTGR